MNSLINIVLLVGRCHTHPALLSFPAGSLPALRFLPSFHDQVYDRTRFFRLGPVSKIFLPVFFPHGRETGEANGHFRMPTIAPAEHVRAAVWPMLAVALRRSRGPERGKSGNSD